MILIESNTATRGVQDQIFILRVLFGLVMMQPSHADDGAADSVLATEAWCHHRVMLVTTQLSHAGDGAAESVLVIARQDVAANH
jgi:hypothetical protein